MFIQNLLPSLILHHFPTAIVTRTICQILKQNQERIILSSQWNKSLHSVTLFQFHFSDIKNRLVFISGRFLFLLKI